MFFQICLVFHKRNKDSNNQVRITHMTYFLQLVDVLQTTDHWHTTNLQISKDTQGHEDTALCAVILANKIKARFLKWQSKINCFF